MLGCVQASAAETKKLPASKLRTVDKDEEQQTALPLFPAATRLI